MTEECVITGNLNLSRDKRNTITKKKKIISTFQLNNSLSLSAANLLSAMDQSVAPCTDFFQYACGTWNRMHVIPEDKGSVSTFEVLADQLLVILKQLIEKPSNALDNDATLKAKLFYKSCMDIRGYNDFTLASLLETRKRQNNWELVIL